MGDWFSERDAAWAAVMILFLVYVELKDCLKELKGIREDTGLMRYWVNRIYGG